MARHGITELLSIDRGFDPYPGISVWPDSGVRTDHVDGTGSGRAKNSSEP